MHGKIIRRLVSGVAAVAVGATVWGGGVAGVTKAQAAEVDGPKVTWLVSLWGPRRGQTEGIERMKELLAEKTGGNFVLDLKYGEVLSGPKENLAGVQAGAFEMAMFCAAYDPTKVPAVSGLELPFIPANAKSFQDRVALEEAYIHHPAVLAELEKWNAYPVMMSTLPSWGLMGTGKPPKSLADLKGRRIMASPQESKIFTSFGAVTSSIPSVEYYQSMERGVIEAASIPWTYTFWTYRLAELSNWWTTDLGKLTGRGTCPYVANKAAYDALPQQYKDLIEASKAEAYKWHEEAYKKIDEVNLKDAEKRGLVEAKLPQAEIDALSESLRDDIWGEWKKTATAAGLPAEDLAKVLMGQGM
ncbi:MAG: TRAP transporter substrate-binding protein DctP [Flavobacteriaceae bacterium]